VTEELVPLLWDTTGEPSAFDPADWFAYCEDITGRPAPRLPSLAVQSVIPDHRKAVETTFGGTFDDFTFAEHPFCVIHYRGHEIVVGISAKGSYAAGGLDELIGLGAQSIIVLGGCGSLIPELHVGDFFAPTKALRDDGVSFHYEPASRYSFPSERLTSCLLQAARAAGYPVQAGPVWSTSAHFRQTIRRLEAFRQEGCMAVNNEGAAAFSVGRFRGAEVASLLVVGDTLASGRFAVPEGQRALDDAASALMEVALQALVMATGEYS
jgi:uridine phosphorylase